MLRVEDVDEDNGLHELKILDHCMTIANRDIFVQWNAIIRLNIVAALLSEFTFLSNKFWKVKPISTMKNATHLVNGIKPMVSSHLGYCDVSRCHTLTSFY
jgi:hypothetical protein